MIDKPVRKMSRDQRLVWQDKTFQAALKEEDAARQKVRANMLRLRALRLAKEAEEIEAAKPAPAAPASGVKRKPRQKIST